MTDQHIASTDAPRIGAGEHPLRRAVTAEVHARPFEALDGPMRVSHLALVTGPDAALHSEEVRHLTALCERHGAQPPQPEANFYSEQMDEFRLRWERHQEFSTYTVFRRGVEDAPFASPAIALLPAEWLAGLPGELLAATHLVLEGDTAPRRSVADLENLFGTDNIAGGWVARGTAMAFTDFRPHQDGFSRFLVQDAGLAPRRAGRLVQRLLEIETYRLMALLAFPMARRLGPEIARLETELHDITDAMTEAKGLADEQHLLEALSRLAARTEHLTAQSSFRLSAAQAYDQLIGQRVESLREERYEYLQTIGKFLERRSAPAMRTCASVAARQEAIARRVSRAANLLRTRVDVALEGQNRDLLASMNRRTRMQLRLQEAVEGLSVVVLSYYTVGLLAYMAKAAKAAGLHVPVDLGVGLAAPLVVGTTWLIIRRLRRGVTGEEAGDGH